MNETRQRRPGRRVGPVGLGVALAGGLLLAGGEASATITLGQVQVAYKDGGAPSYGNRPSADLYWISYEDCINDVTLSWGVTASEQFSVGASAGGTCPQSTTISSSLQNCWPVPNASGVSSPATVYISARQLVQGTLGITDCDPSTAPANSGIVWPQPITIYFYASTTISGGTGDSTTWTQTEIALEGPAAPEPLTLGVGDQELIAGIPSMQNSDVQGYYFYCYPLGSGGDAGTSTSSTSSSSTSSTSTSSTSSSSTSGSSTDAGSDGGGGMGGTTTSSTSTTGTGGTGGTGGTSGTGGSVSSSCPAGTTIPGLNPNNPDPNSPYVCGSQVPSTTTSYNLTKINNSGLQDGTAYAVGVAAFDVVGNVGPLSVLQCATPQPVNSFFPTYCADGGPGCAGGCGSCNIGSETEPLWPALGTLALGCVAVITRRSRRSARARKDHR